MIRLFDANDVELKHDDIVVSKDNGDKSKVVLYEEVQGLLNYNDEKKTIFLVTNFTCKYDLGKKTIKLMDYVKQDKEDILFKEHLKNSVSVIAYEFDITEDKARLLLAKWVNDEHSSSSILNCKDDLERYLDEEEGEE